MEFQILLINWKRKFQEYDSKLPFPDRIKSRAFPYNQPQGVHKPRTDYAFYDRQKYHLRKIPNKL